MERIQQVPVNQLLDMVEAHWDRATLARYGIPLNDLIRDRIAVLGAAASVANADTTTEHDDTPLYKNENENQESARDVILENAASELDADTVLRAIYVMGIFAGRRKRDVEFFELLGFHLMRQVDSYTDPNKLVNVLTALNRAKVKPSPQFLHHLARRIPVLAKNTPLQPLSCYRAISNFNHMGHTQMDIYRFLSDCMVASIEANLAAEKASGGPNREREKDGGCQKNRLIAITGLPRPSMFTKWLYVLARWGAPHQVYLRPYIPTLIVPMLPFFPPPSFTRLLDTIRRFRCSDPAILEPIIAHLLHQYETTKPVARVDVMLVLCILSEEEANVVSNFGDFMRLCHDVLSLQPLEVIPERRSHRRKVPQLVRPIDMCTTVLYLGRLQRRVEIPLEELDPLLQLVEQFAVRLLHLLNMGVVSLSYVDSFLAAAGDAQYPDTHHSIRRLLEARQAIDDEDDYYARLDIDVRELLFKIVTVNGNNTYFHYRPLPGALQVDFREALAHVSFLDLMEAIVLYETANPNALQFETNLLLTRSILAKVKMTGEEVVDEEGRTLKMDAPKDILLTREDLKKLVSQVKSFPIAAVQTSPEVWAFIANKAATLHEDSVLEEAKKQLEVQNV
ncbi:hypothetical protein AGDE_02396 [Angomonas deanei]|nr:hypothetical protein AGDE_02396 [Angomonas deanei]|eukprot:EPY41528.1 hypothetical protein AGDE_02396 [Angomonas deanei]